VAKDYEDRLRAGGLGYGDLKKALFEHYWNYFAAARAKRAELAANVRMTFVNSVWTRARPRRARWRKASRGRWPRLRGVNSLVVGSRAAGPALLFRFWSGGQSAATP
jgi:hypothetical protein